MPVLIIGGGGSEKPEGKKGIPEMRKRMDGIGGKYASSSKDTEEPASEMDTGKRRLEAGKLLLRAVKMNDPELAAEAVATLVECCSSDGDGADAEGESEDSGEMG